MVCCKKCGGHLFPYIKDMERKRIDEASASHTCLEIKIKNDRESK
jgi:hypothetical protein